MRSTHKGPIGGSTRDLECGAAGLGDVDRHLRPRAHRARTLHQNVAVPPTRQLLSGAHRARTLQQQQQQQPCPVVTLQQQLLPGRALIVLQMRARLLPGRAMWSAGLAPCLAPCACVAPVLPRRGARGLSALNRK